MRPRFAVLAAALVVFAAPARAELATGIKAVVHDSVITYDDVEELTEQTADVLRRQYARKPEEYQKKINEARSENLDKLTDRELILHEFKTAGYSLPDSVIDEVVQARIRAYFGDRRTAAKTLQARGLTFEKFREQERERFIVDAMRAKNVAQEFIISPHKIEAYYTNHMNDYKVEDEVKLRTIILNKGSDPAKARKMAEEILAKLKEGASFAEMAGVYSQGAEKAQGGSRDWQEVRELRKELADAIASLNVGGISGIVEASDSLWLLQVEDKRPARIRPLSEVRDEIEKELIVTEKKRLERQWLDKLRRKTFVRYF